jgi:uncharacterized YccA/Bax inhibitor family protein
MESRNPVFARRGAFGRQKQQQAWTPSPQHLENMYNAPTYTPPATQRPMTYDDVVVRGFLTLATLVAAGAAAWVLNFPVEVALGAMLVGLVLWAIITFGNKANAALVLSFAATYGVAVGIISREYNNLYYGIVLQAVIGTALAFGAMLAVHSLRIIRVTPKFTRYVIGAGLALVGLMIINMLASLFGVDGGIGIRESGPLGIAFSLVAILVGCFFLLLDFHAIDEGVRGGAPARFAWLMAFGLVLSLVWIYLEVLRLLSYLRE